MNKNYKHKGLDCWKLQFANAFERSFLCNKEVEEAQSRAKDANIRLADARCNLAGAIDEDRNE